MPKLHGAEQAYLSGKPTRRKVLRGIAAAGLGSAAASPLARRAWAQAKAPVSISFWTFDNPQQRPWVNKRVKLFMEQNANVKVDFQWFAFGDLGKKLSVGFATGTAPDGFVSQDWFMPTWLAKGLLAPLDVQRLGYPSLPAFQDDFAPAFVSGAVQNGKAYGYPLWFYGYCNYLNTKHFKEVGLDPEKDAPKTWAELGEVAKGLTVEDGDKCAGRRVKRRKPRRHKSCHHSRSRPMSAPSSFRGNARLGEGSRYAGCRDETAGSASHCQ